MSIRGSTSASSRKSGGTRLGYLFMDRIRITRLWPAALIIAIWLFVFLPMMTGQTVAGFRDSTQLYYPLFEFIDSVRASGEIPLWNPYDNFGAPLLADGTSSVMYPGKLIFFRRVLEYPARYGIYLAIHVLIAAAGTYWLARTLKASPAGATLAAISYAFGGSFFFQLCNVIYLVSGAWLPFAIGCVWKMNTTVEYKWAVGAGFFCALMILGGDPQMVYHVGLIAVAKAGATLARRRRRQWKNRKRSSARTGAYRWWLAANLRIAAMVSVTVGLSAVQLLPTYCWSQRSERLNPQLPQNVYGAADYLLSESEPVTGRRTNLGSVALCRFGNAATWRRRGKAVGTAAKTGLAYPSRTVLLLRGVRLVRRGLAGERTASCIRWDKPQVLK